MQGNMVISCSSVFYPQTFCLAGMVFLPPSKQETKSLSSNLLPASNPTSIRPRVLRARQRSWHGQLWAQSSGTCPDQAPREVEEEMPAQAAQLALCWFNPLAIWSLLPAMHAACSGKWKLSAGFSFFFFFLTFLQTRMHEKSREPWLASGTMLLVRTEESMHRKSKMPLGKDPTESACSENHSHSNLWGLLGVSSNREDNRKSNLSGK